jgi:hypothetical protein
MNIILICCCYSQIFELCYILKYLISCIYTEISCILVMRHKHIRDIIRYVVVQCRIAGRCVASKHFLMILTSDGRTSGDVYPLLRVLHRDADLLNCYVNLLPDSHICGFDS